MRRFVLALAILGADAFALSGRGLVRPRPLVHAPPHAPLPPRASPVRLAEEGFKVPFILDIGTKGGVVFYGILGTVLPFIAYGYLTGPGGMDVVAAGNIILVGYVGLATVGWTASYVFRVANKDMTYAKQLKDYEQAVIQKRFDELSTDEVDALMGEIYPDKEAAAPKK